MRHPLFCPSKEEGANPRWSIRGSINPQFAIFVPIKFSLNSSNMKNITLILIALMLTQFQESFSQTFNLEWAIVAENNMTGGDIAVDANGNVFIAGYNNDDLIVSKYDENGTLISTLNIETTAPSSDKVFITIDGSNNVIVVGTFVGTTDFQPGIATYELFGWEYAIFIAKYDNGLSSLLFANVVGDELIPKAVTISPSNDIYLAYKNTAGSSSDAFIVKFDNSGNEIWEFEINAPWGHVTVTDIEVNNQNELFLGGYLFQVTQSPDFDPDPNDVWTNVGGLMFYAKYTTDMDFVWVKGLNVGNANEVRIAYDDGSLFVASTGNGDIDPNPSVVSVNGSYFIGKYDSSTGDIQWGREISTTVSGGGSNLDDDILDLEINSQGSIILCGTFYGDEVIFDGVNPNGIHESTGQYDGFIAAYDIGNNYMGGLSMITTGSSWAKSIAVADNGTVYSGGYYYGTTDFDPNGTFNLYSPTNDPQLFLAKYSGLLTSTNAETRLQNVHIYPNPNSGQFELVLSNFDGSDYQLFDNLGQLVASGSLVSERTNIDVQALAKGIYTLQLRTPKGTITQKLVRQ